MGSEQVAIDWSTDGGQLRAALELRERVFCEEQGVPLELEHDGLDEAASHLVALSAQGEVIGTLRLIEQNGTAKIGRVAVERAWRRRGVALSMLELALQRARAHRCTRARLAAQVEASELYRRAGFEVESAEFQEAGITHVWMGRELDEPSLTGGGDAGPRSRSSRPPRQSAARP